MMKPLTRIDIYIGQQHLLATAIDGHKHEFVVSTALNGPGESMDSECTPRGRHEISEKIGADCELNAVFVGRRPTGEIYSEALAKDNPGRDWILTRILWLSGLEPGLNQYGRCDSKARYIYIHGTPDSTELGRPGSRGCIRMNNGDVIALFDASAVGTPVHIHE